jgi:16S rRNA processing protein RimM
MIELNEVQRIGQIVKPHGVGGEMAVTVPASLDWTDDIDCLVCSLDGILVPFFLESIRPKSSTTILVKFEGYDSVESTSRFMGVTVYMPLRFVAESDEEEPSWSSFLDWRVVDSKTGPLGTVDAVDDSTPNILFQVRDGGRERIIPANPEWITRVDRKNRTLMYNLPEGLTEL